MVFSLFSDQRHGGLMLLSEATLPASDLHRNKVEPARQIDCLQRFRPTKSLSAQAVRPCSYIRTIQ
jgi:hypothetical protein